MAEECTYHEIEAQRRAANREYDRRVRELRDSCPHAELTGWLAGGLLFGWAECRLCKRCMRVVRERRPAEEKADVAGPLFATLEAACPTT